MSKITTSIRITEELHKTLTAQAQKLGVSFNAYVIMVLSEKVK